MVRTIAQWTTGQKVGLRPILDLRKYSVADCKQPLGVSDLLGDRAARRRSGLEKFVEPQGVE
jgi:hypothetical protein